MKPLLIAEEAEYELAGSVAFYEKRQSGLGLDFERAAQRVLKKIASSPDRWPVGRYGTRHYLMQRLIEELITKNKPFKIETASGRVFEVPHRDFVSFSTRRTSLIVSYEENAGEHFAIVPLLTITSAMAPA